MRINMDRFEQLKDYILMKELDCGKCIEGLQKDISNATFDTPDDLNELYEKADNLKYYCKELEKINRKLQILIFDEYKIRQSLKEFYPDGVGFQSFIYEDIRGNVDDFKYYVNGIGFETYGEAEKYSMSLGEREDWLEYAYSYL